MSTEPLPPAAGPTGPPPTDRRGPAVAVVLLGALLVLVGIGWLLDANGIVVPWRAILPSALVAIGLATVAGSFRGRQEALMVVGVVLTVVLSLAAATDWDLDVPLGGGVGDRNEQPVTPADLSDYELGAGDFHLDLRQLQVPPGTTTVRARVGFGELAVDLPGGVAVEVDARAGVGNVQALGREESGVGSRLEVSTQDGGGDRRLVLDLRVGFGQVEVDR
jgi:Cell wall-active antibiotics response 4TMS YvqF